MIVTVAVLFDGGHDCSTTMGLRMSAIEPSNIDNVEFMAFPSVDAKECFILGENFLGDGNNLRESRSGCDIVGNAYKGKLRTLKSMYLFEIIGRQASSAMF